MAVYGMKVIWQITEFARHFGKRPKHSAEEGPLETLVAQAYFRSYYNVFHEYRSIGVSVDLEEASECCVCLNKTTKGTLCRPISHPLCMDCSNRLSNDKCPLCRQARTRENLIAQFGAFQEDTEGVFESIRRCFTSK